MTAPQTTILARATVAAATLALATALALLLGTPDTLAKPRTQATKAPPSLYWGATIGEQFTGEKAPWDMRAVDRFERLTRKRMSVIGFSSPWAQCGKRRCSFYTFPTTPMENVRRHGAIPFFSWNSASSPPRMPDRRFRLAKIIRGHYDGYIREFATAAREWGHPFFLRFNWEMNGFWFPWSDGVNGNRRGSFKRAWRHVHDIFEAVGATNATWVWCPNVDFTRKLTPLNTLYPGHRYVDWTCMSGFNWGNRPDSGGWQNFNQIFRSTYRRIVRIAPRKPIIIGEMASTDRGGNKAAWIRHTLRVIPRYRKLRGFLWFDVNDRGTNWPIERSRATIRAFARGIRNGAYQPNRFGGITTSPIPPPSRG